MSNCEPHLIVRNTDPTEAPPAIGIHWINNVTKVEFFSIGTDTVADWQMQAQQMNLRSDTLVDNIVIGVNNFTTALITNIKAVTVTDQIGNEYEFDYTYTGNNLTIESVINLSNAMIILKGE